MKIAVAQLNYSVGDFESNKYKIIGAIGSAKQQGAKLVVFAECAICGTPAHSLLARTGFLDNVEEALVEIAAFCDDITAVVGLPVQHEGGTVSAAAVIQNRRIVGYVTKHNRALDIDAAYLVDGQGVGCFLIGGEKVAIAIGADILSSADYSSADTVICMAADRYSQGRIERRYDVLARNAFQADANIVFVNQVGGACEVLYDGSSAVFNPQGKAIRLLASFEEDMALFDTKAVESEVEVPYQDKISNVTRALKMGICDYFNKNRLEKAGLVLTGGIDSSVAAVLLVDALGADRVVALQMPSRYSLEEDAADAAELARRLGIELVTVPLFDIYRSALDTIVGAIGEPDTERMEADFQMRLRTALFMAVCDKRGLVPVNCSNKTELAVGALTLYGDSSGMVALLGDLYKSDVFSVAHKLNRNRDIIPESIMDKEPSSEQELELQNLPPYDVIDAILYRLLERWQDREEIINAGFEQEDVDMVRNLIYGSLEKVYQFCPILEVSTLPLDKSYVDLPKNSLQHEF